MNMDAGVELLQHKVKSRARACVCNCIHQRLYLLIILLCLVMQAEFTALSLVGYF